MIGRPERKNPPVRTLREMDTHLRDGGGTAALTVRNTGKLPVSCKYYTPVRAGDSYSALVA